MVAVLVSIAALAPALAVGRAIVDDWTPVGDNAAIAVHTLDVFSSDSPLLGVRTTLGGAELELHVRHLGPLEFWVLSIPAWVSGGDTWGLLVGVAVVGIASLAAVGWASGRMTGWPGAAWALGLTAVTCWSLGRHVLASPWNPHIAVLPLVAALFLTWAAVAGDGWALPPLAFAVSFAAQAHLLYAPLALLLFVGAVAAVVRQATRRQLVTTVVVSAIAWSFPIWEQITNQPGNFVEVSRALGAEEQVRVGWDYALPAAARAVGIVPLFARPARAFEFFGAPLTIVTFVSAIAVVGSLAALTVVAVRSRDRLGWSAGGVALAALAVATATSAQVPHEFGDVFSYQMLTLWPVGCFAWFALGLLVVRTFSLRAPARRLAVGVAVALLVVSAPAGALTDSGVPADDRYMTAVRELVNRMESTIDGLGTVRIETVGEYPFTPVLYGLVYQLRQRGVDARVAPGDLYIGRQHTAPPDAPSIIVVVGGATASLGPGAQRIASYRTWSAADLERLMELDRRLRSVLTASGIEQLRDEDPYELHHDGTITRLVVAGDLHLSDEDLDLLRSYSDLRFEVEELVFTAYLVPGR